MRRRRRVDPVAERDRLDNEHLRLLLAFLLRPESCCVDVGAHEGAVLADMVRYAPAGRHLAFEPVPAYHGRLAAAFPDVDVRCVALADVAGEATFNYVENLPGMSGLHRRWYPADPDITELVVRTARLDDELPDGFVPAVIKIDVEGAEHLVLQGARATILRHRPTVVVEYGRGSEPFTGFGPDAMYELLTGELGYRVFDLDGGGPYTLDGFTATPHWQFVCHD